MKRFGLVIIGMTLAAAWGTGTARAQKKEGSWTLQGDAAATLGHTSSSSFGGEVDYRWTDNWELFLESGRMGNVTTADVQNRANQIGTAVSATANPVQHAVYYDVGVRHPLMPAGSWNPYVAVGIGGTRVHTETTFTQNGHDVTSALETSGVLQPGLDLQGSVTKAFFTLGGGVNVPFKSKYFFDGSFRYGRIFSRTGLIEGDKGVNTLRLQLGFGFGF
jgi:opacity protein-like surface antigen